MTTFNLTADQEVALTLQFVDKFNNPVTAPSGTPAWSVDNTALATLNVAGDGLSASLVAVGPVGTVNLTVSLDGVNGTLQVDVAAGAVAAITVVPGAVTNHP